VTKTCHKIVYHPFTKPSKKKNFNKLSNLKCIKIPKRKKLKRRKKGEKFICSSSISYTNIQVIKKKRRVKMMTMMMVMGRKK
jgi:hypothetical protein